jgi:hypothetical protein
MTHLEMVAHHEAAHSVLAVVYRRGLCGGIDLHAPTSVPGATGQTNVNLYVPDPTATDEEQRLNLARNLAIICAGAASDAKTGGLAPRAALVAQVGDHRAALAHAALHPVVSGSVQIDFAVNFALDLAVVELAKPVVWLAVEDVAAACLANAGTLDQATVESMTAHL